MTPNRPNTLARPARRRAEAMQLAGVKTKKETVNLALREYAARHRRIEALEHYAALAAGWDHQDWEQRRAEEKDPAT